MNTPAKKPARATAKRSNESDEVVFWIGAKHHITLRLWSGERMRLSRHATAIFRARAKEAGIGVALYIMPIIEKWVKEYIHARKQVA